MTANNMSDDVTNMLNRMTPYLEDKYIEPTKELEKAFNLKYQKFIAIDDTRYIVDMISLCTNLLDILQVFDSLPLVDDIVLLISDMIIQMYVLIGDKRLCDENEFVGVSNINYTKMLVEHTHLIDIPYIIETINKNNIIMIVPKIGIPIIIDTRISAS